MRRLLLGLTALAAALGLVACVDRGRCLASTTVHHDGYSYFTTMSFDGGKTSTLIPQYRPAWDEDVCTEWEFPNGRPEGNDAARS